MSYDQIFDLFELFIKDVFVFIWRIIRPNMNNDVVDLFSDLELSETLDLRYIAEYVYGSFIKVAQCFCKLGGRSEDCSVFIFYLQRLKLLNYLL